LRVVLWGGVKKLASCRESGYRHEVVGAHRISGRNKKS
jgi:hypothetical protein